MKKILALPVLFLFTLNISAQKDSTIKKKDRKRDVLLVTSLGEIAFRLSDATPLHRDNFLKLVKVGFYDSILFHRVIQNFMIQAGDPHSRQAEPGKQLGNGGPGYTVPAEFTPTLFHKKGAVAAARMGDNVNPAKASSGSQFYIVQGKTFSDAELDALESGRLNGRKIPANQRELFKTIGGTPHLDENYTVFGEVIKGLDVIDKIARVKSERDRPVEDVRIIEANLIKRKKR